ncbi:MAG: DNA primase [Oscillospiraceae bacterium]|nr:DNA primase [Oscillospiraceae bacterium]
MPLFPDSFIQELTERTDLVELVSGYVPLTLKSGSYWGCCPFHSEKTASFHVLPDRQIYHCFGCKKGGGAINFIMEIENLGFQDAVRFLAQRAGLTVPETGDATMQQSRQRLLELNRDAARFFHETLRAPEGAAGAEYFRRRGLTAATIRHFGLGVAPDAWDSLLKAMTAKGYTKQELLDAGLAVRSKNGGLYDRFRNRVIFPIIDLRGGVIAFGGRVLDSSLPKYINTPDTLLFNKKRNLFALNFARKSKQGRLILTEGYMDTVSLHQAGFDCAVAMLGTGCTEYHAQLMARYTKEVVISGDTDGPGLAAVQRAIGVLEKTGLSVRVLRLPEGKDPDEFIRSNGPAAFQRLLDRAENHIEYRLLQIRGRHDLTLDEDRVAFLQEAAELIASLPSPVEREIYSARAAEAASVSPAAVENEVARTRKRMAKAEQQRRQRRDLNPASVLQPKDRSLRYDNLRSARAEEGVLRLLAMDPHLLEEAAGLRGDQFSSPLLGRIYERMAADIRAGRPFLPDLLAEELSSEEMDHLTTLLQQPEQPENRSQALEDCIEIITTEACKRAAPEDPDLLLRMQQRYREKKSYGGERK